MTDRILYAFLERQFEEGMALARESDRLDLEPLGPAPVQRYMASYHARGLALDREAKVVETDRCDIGIWLPDRYLRQVDVAQVLTYLGPHPTPWHPNIRPPFVCLHLRPGTPLVDVLYSCYETWTWDLFATGDGGLNHGAAQWARNQPPERFPVDRRPLKRRSLRLNVEHCSPEGSS